jgi:PAS domain-containing protein
MAPRPETVAAPGRPPPGPPWAAALLGVALLLLCHPLTWGVGDALWAPQAGVGLALCAWLGGRGALAVLAGTALAAARDRLLGPPTLTAASALAEPLVAAAQAAGAWWLYQRGAGGARGLGDPRSAVLFLLLAPGLAAAAGVAARAAVAALSGGDGAFVGPWLAEALGVAVLAPPLLVGATPALARRGLALPEVVAAEEASERGDAADAPARGDVVEIVGLAVGAAGLGLVLAALAGRRDLAGWQGWGAPLLLVVWAALRQGLRGGTAVAAAAAAVPLLFVRPGGDAARALQTDLLTQCAVALLVSAASAWVRLSEARYRRVFAQVPVVIYSARVTEPAPAGRPPRAEVTLVSAASVAVLGCPPAALLGEHERWLARVHPDDHEVLWAALTQLSRQRGPVTCEYRLARPEGAPSDPGSDTPVVFGVPAGPRVRWVRDTLAPRLGPDGLLAAWDRTACWPAGTAS